MSEVKRLTQVRSLGTSDTYRRADGVASADGEVVFSIPGHSATVFVHPQGEGLSAATASVLYTAGASLDTANWLVAQAGIEAPARVMLDFPVTGVKVTSADNATAVEVLPGAGMSISVEVAGGG